VPRITQAFCAFAAFSFTPFSHAGILERIADKGFLVAVIGGDPGTLSAR